MTSAAKHPIQHPKVHARVLGHCKHTLPPITGNTAQAWGSCFIEEPRLLEMRPAFIDSSDRGISLKRFCDHNPIVSCLPTIRSQGEVAAVVLTGTSLFTVAAMQ